MKAIAIFTLVIWCIGVESLPGVREKRETKGCSFLLSDEDVPSGKRYHVFVNAGTKSRDHKGAQWQESIEACQALGGDLAEPSTPEEQDKIMEGLSKLPSEHRYYSYWIGIEKKTADAGWTWVSGNKMELDSGLKLWNPKKWKQQLNVKGAICHTTWNEGFLGKEGDIFLHGYVCEFTNASPICIQ